MVSTQKMVLMAIFIQIILGSVVELAINPSEVPSEVIAKSTNVWDQIHGDTSDFDSQIARDPNNIAGEGSTGLNVVTAITWLFGVFLNGFTVPYTYQPGGVLVDQIIIWGIRAWHAILTGFFAMELYMFIISKKQS